MFRWIRGLAPLLMATAMLSPAGASAQVSAVTTQAVNLRAGPDRAFPLVAWLPAGAPVNVVGCTDAWRWCDVVWGFNRGWIFARFLSTPLQNQPTVIFNAGPTLGVPLIDFSVGNYWGAHYRNRPWWHNRNHWANQPPTWKRPPPRPPGARPPSRSPSGGRRPSGSRGRP